MRIPYAINAYVLGDVLVDAGGRRHGERIMGALDGHRLTAHVITHAHPDHQGASHAICTRLSIPFWVGEGDVDAAETPALIRERQPAHPIARLMDTVFTCPGHMALTMTRLLSTFAESARRKDWMMNFVSP